MRFVVVGIAVVVAAACATPSVPSSNASASAAAATKVPAGPAPGQWQLVLEIDEMSGASGKVPLQTMSMCSTPEDKKQWQEMLSGKSLAGCNVTDFAASGSNIRYTLQCGGGLQGTASITVIDDDNYRGESTLTLKAGDKPSVIRSRMTGKRIAKTCGK